MSIKQIIKSVVGQKTIDSVRGAFKKKEPIKIPVDDRTEVELRKVFYKNFLKQGSLCFDVGANMGNRITPVLELGANVVAVEPQEFCRVILKKKFGNKIKLVPFGLGEKEEIKEFYIADASTISSFSTEWIESVKKDRFKEHNWNTVQKVQMTTLDKLISKYGLPDFIKIDVEGYELEVLKGLTKTIPCISYEYTTPEQTHKAIACIDYLQGISKRIECNYSVGESMQLELNEWKSPEEMKTLINSQAFIDSGFGDIYIRSYSA